MKLRRSLFYSLFIIVLLTTEFFYIEVGGGVARAYHFWFPVIVLLLVGSVPQLFRSRVFLAIMLFAGVNLIAAILSETPSSALASLMSNFANLGIVIAVALILLRGRLSIEQLTRIILVVTVISVAWGVIQILVGSSLALSPEQESQIQIGFGPGFRTEANTFGKYMLLPFLLFLPTLLYNRRARLLWFIYAVMLVGILMNFTRTALYGITAAIIFAFIWYATKGQLNKLTMRFSAIGIVAVLGLSLMLSGAVPISDYARFKLENFFNKEELIEGGSSAYRLAAMEAVLDNTFDSGKRMLIGNGWGQTYYEVQGEIVQAGGSDTINILGFSGFLGVASYLLFTAHAFLVAVRLARRRDRSTQTLFAEGVVFAIVGMFVTGQLSGYLITPEYYLLLGICVYLSLLRKPRSSYGPNTP